MPSRFHVNWNWTWIICIALLLALVGSISVYYKGYQQPIDLLAIAGAIASTFGLLIIFIQVSAIRSTTDAAHMAAQSTHDEVMSFLLALDITRTVKLVQEIQLFNRSKRFEIAIIRMQDLKYVLRNILNNSRFSELIDHQRYQDHINKISLQIGSLEKEFQQPSKKINTARMNKVFELVLNDLVDIDTRLKQKGETNEPR